MGKAVLSAAEIQCLAAIYKQHVQAQVCDVRVTLGAAWMHKLCLYVYQAVFVCAVFMCRL